MKLIRSLRKRTETDSLYDLATDPGELRPVFWSQQRARSKTAREGFEALRALLAAEEVQASRARATRGEQDPFELPEDLEERLRALGYLQ